MKKNSKDQVIEGMKMIKTNCINRPTCKGCDFRLKHKGCYFWGKLPRDWDTKGGEG